MTPTDRLTAERLVAERLVAERLSAGLNEKKRAQLKTARELAGRLKVEVLAHFYQRAEVKAAADFVGGSLEVMARALALPAGRRALVCGASFMLTAIRARKPRAEIAAPRTDISCPLSEAVSAAEAAEARRLFPRALWAADIKARPELLADLEITPETAAAELARTRGAELLALPGAHLVDWAGFGDRLVRRWPQAVCQVHELASLEDLAVAQARRPGALIAANLLCRPEVRAAADFVGDSAGLRRFCAESRSGEFIVISEAGLAEYLTAALPHKLFYETEAELFCPNMKLTGLKHVIAALEALEGET